MTSTTPTASTLLATTAERRCPDCSFPLRLMLDVGAIPDRPSRWVRLWREGLLLVWQIGDSPPESNESASKLCYGCPICAQTFRIVLTML